MKKAIIIVVALLPVLTACNENNKSNDINMNVNQKEKVKEVPGRRNFGTQRPVMTPQPCIMIATYDKNQVPDVMMAAWGGQCDYDKITFDLGAHKTTENIKLKKGINRILFRLTRVNADAKYNIVMDAGEKTVNTAIKFSIGTVKH